MAIQSRSTLKTFFETGDKPTEEQFYALIDSLVHRSEDSAAFIVSAPTTPTAQGSPGQIAYDLDYIYVCVAANTWRRSALIADW